MAINPISEYPEVTELTENDYFPVGTPTGLKKIKGSNLGGGGGVVIEVTFDVNTGILSTDKTAGEILALATAGTPFTGVGSVDNDGMTMYFQMQFGITAYTGDQYMLTAQMISVEGIQRITFGATSADSPMTASMN